MANYIHTLRDQVAQLEADKAELRAQLDRALELVVDFEAHMALPKFHNDTTIQTSDVYRRLATLKSELM